MRSRYRILQALTTEELERLVNKLVEVGFIPVGGPFYAPGSGFWLMQAVFDPAPTEREAESSTPGEASEPEPFPFSDQKNREKIRGGGTGEAPAATPTEPGGGDHG
jgi:hypothetical protein